MRKFVIALVAVFTVVPSVSASGSIEKHVTYYDSDMYYTQVGDATFYCDGSIVTNGLVTSSAVEVYYGC